MRFSHEQYTIQFQKSKAPAERFFHILYCTVFLLTMTISFIGGDARAVALARRFEQKGARVRTLALPAGAPCPCRTLAEAADADAVILPLPATRDGVYPTTVDGLKAPPLASILSLCEKHTLLLGGRIGDALARAAAAAGVRLLDYYEDETLLAENAYATAEVAVGMAMRDLSVTLRGARVGVIGSGRIARALLSLLMALGARVDVYARNPVSLASLAARGADPHLFGEGTPLLLDGGLRAVFSTVPVKVLKAEALSLLRRGTPLYDLGVGGIDSDAAAHLALVTPDCRALPGRFVPESAASYLFFAIDRILSAEGVYNV